MMIAFRSDRQTYVKDGCCVMVVVVVGVEVTRCW